MPAAFPGVTDADGYPRELEADVPLRDGGTIHVRPIRADDAGRLQAFHRRLSRDSIFFRFFSHLPELTDERAAYFTRIDYQRRMAIVAVSPGADGDEIVGVIRYDVIAPGRAEMALIVEDRYQHHGIGAALLDHLILAARERGIRTIVADVLAENWRMLRLLRESGNPTVTRRHADVVRVELTVTGTPQSVDAGGYGSAKLD
ncbi:MAG: GNAT family N-acetyltransferase [Chloroflexota bacterium]|nr:GNAT family N-acetyltransferase [Chloroflexota bacterium]